MANAPLAPPLKYNHVYVYIYICLSLPYVLNPGSAPKILRTQLGKGNGRLGKLAIDTLDLSMIKKTAADSKAKGKKPGSTRGLLG